MKALAGSSYPPFIQPPPLKGYIQRLGVGVFQIWQWIWHDEVRNLIASSGKVSESATSMMFEVVIESFSPVLCPLPGRYVFAIGGADGSDAAASPGPSPSSGPGSRQDLPTEGCGKHLAQKGHGMDEPDGSCSELSTPKSCEPLRFWLRCLLLPENSCIFLRPQDA